MLTVVVCVGSSCYVRGSETVAETFERLVKRERLDGQVEITGAFCMERCSMGVSVHLGEQTYSGLLPEDAEDFFYREIVPQVAALTE